MRPTAGRSRLRGAGNVHWASSRFDNQVDHTGLTLSFVADISTLASYKLLSPRHQQTEQIRRAAARPVKTDSASPRAAARRNARSCSVWRARRIAKDFVADRMEVGTWVPGHRWTSLGERCLGGSILRDRIEQEVNFNWGNIARGK